MFRLLLEIDRDAGEHVSAERVVDLRIGVAVAEDRKERLGSEDRRRLVEDVVRTNAQVELVRDAGRHREVEIVLRGDPLVRWI